MPRHLMSTIGLVGDRVGRSAYALCGTYPSDAFAMTLSVKDTTCKRCLKSRALAVCIEQNAPVLASGKTHRDLPIAAED